MVINAIIHIVVFRQRGGEVARFRSMQAEDVQWQMSSIFVEKLLEILEDKGLVHF